VLSCGAVSISQSHDKLKERQLTVTVAGCTLSETKSFKYLGAMFNSEASCDEEVKSRLTIARQRLSELVPTWKLRTVSNKLKARLIKALV